MRTNKKRAQSTVEYILLMTAVVSVILIFLMGPDKIFPQANSTNNASLSPFQEQINQAYSSATDGALRSTNRLFTSLLNYTNSAN
jgi:hypothetical protein